MSRGSAKTYTGLDPMTARPCRLGDRTSGWYFGLVALILFWAAPARAEALVADLTNHLIAITTGFTGASVVLFGAIDGPGDVVVVVRGPDREMTVRRKRRIAGIWVNSQEVIFANVPSFYFVGASRRSGRPACSAERRSDPIRDTLSLSLGSCLLPSDGVGIRRTHGQVKGKLRGDRKH